MFGWLFSRRALAVLASLVAVIALITATARLRTSSSQPEAWLVDAFAPVARIAQSATSILQQAQQSVAEIGRLRMENEQLRQQLAEYQEKERVFERAIAAHTRLRALLSLKEKVPEAVAAATVIYRPPDNWLQQLVVDMGAADGVTADMIALTPEGVAGRVLRVTRHTATVLLLTDAQSGVGITVERSGDVGVAVGSPNADGTLRVRFFGREPDVRVGDRLVTSGHGSVFPPNLIVGTVTSLSHDTSGLLQLAAAEPAVDFDRLHEVLIARYVSGLDEEATEPVELPRNELGEQLNGEGLD